MWWLSALASAHIPVIVNTGPDQDWCGAFESALQGDLLLLDPGDYTGPCTLVGKPPDPAYPTEYSVFAARLSEDRPRFHWDGISSAILTVEGEQTQVAWLEFPDVPKGVTAVEIHDSRALWLLDNGFRSVAGTAIATVGAPIRDLRVSEIEVVGGGGTGLSIEGSGFLLEDILVNGLQLGVRVVGEGAVAEVVSDTGIGLDLAGSPLTVKQSAIRGQVIVRDAVTLESNVVIGQLTTEGGGARLYGNTFYEPKLPPLVLTAWTAASVLQDNALSGPIPEVAGASGNVACPDAEACWRDPSGFDLYPVAGGPLTTGTVPPDEGVLYADWCGFARQDPITAGAFEALGAPIAPIDFDTSKSYASCAAVAEVDSAGPADTGEAPDTGNGPATPPGSEPGRSGCGCATAWRPGWPALPGGLVAAAVLGNRRARRGTRWGAQRGV